MRIPVRASLSAVIVLGLTMAFGGRMLALSSSQRQPISIGILIEASDKVAPMLSMAHAGVNYFLQTLLPADEVFVMAFGRTSADVIDFTQDKAAVSEAFGKFLARGEPTLHTTLDAAIKKMNEKARNEGKVLLLITSGDIQDSDMGRSRGMVGKDKIVMHSIGMVINCGLCERGIQDLVKLTGGTYGGMTTLPGRQYTIGPSFQALAQLIAMPQ